MSALGWAGFYRRNHETRTRGRSVFASCDKAHWWACTTGSGGSGSGTDPNRPGFESSSAISWLGGLEHMFPHLSHVPGAGGGRAGAGLTGP